MRELELPERVNCILNFCYIPCNKKKFIQLLVKTVVGEKRKVIILL